MCEATLTHSLTLGMLGQNALTDPKVSLRELGSYSLCKDTIITVLERHTRIRRRAVLSESAPPPLLSWPSGQSGVVEAGRK